MNKLYDMLEILQMHKFIKPFVYVTDCMCL